MEDQTIIAFNIQDTRNAIDSLKFLASSYSSNAGSDSEYVNYVATGSVYNPNVEVSTLSVNDVIDSSVDVSSFVGKMSNAKTVSNFFKIATDNDGTQGMLVELMKRIYKMEELIMHDVSNLETIVGSVEDFDNSQKVR